MNTKERQGFSLRLRENLAPLRAKKYHAKTQR